MSTVTPRGTEAPVSGVVETPQAVAQDETPIPPPKTEEDKRFEQLAYREKRMRNEARRLQTERQEVEAMKAKYATPQVDESWKQRATENPLAHLSELGITADKLTDMLLNRDLTKEEVVAVKTKLNQIEANQNKIIQDMEDSKTQSYDQAVKQIGTEVRLMVQGAPEFEAIQNANAENAVVKLIEETWKSEGYIMDIADAAQEVEDYLVEEAIKFSQLNKVKNRLNQTPNEIPIQKPGTKAPTTLTHATQKLSKPMTDKERKERAILAFQGKLSG